MRTSDIIDKVKIPRHKLYYLEQKGYVTPKKVPMGDLETRVYTEQDLMKVKLIWKYLKEGFKHKVAYEKAMKEMPKAQQGRGAA